MSITQKIDTGLDGIVAAETRLSLVDGEAGRLIIAGYEVPDLVASFTFEETVARLWETAGSADAARDAADLGRARGEAFELVPQLLEIAADLSIIEGLRAGVALLPDEADLRAAVRLVGAMPVWVAALCRQRAGEAPLAPDAQAGHAADYFRMLRGRPADAAEAAAMQTYLTMISDHGMNASTFAARVVASTRAGMVSSVTAAICALKGPLHGGAPGPVLDMLDALAGKPIEPWIDAELARGERLMGFGHRIYRVRDPRADVLNGTLETLSHDNQRIGFARAVEKVALEKLRAAKPDRPMGTNVEFYTALLLEALGIPRDAFTPTFAVGRVAGWTAHVIEQEMTGRLIRPQSRYIGEMPSRCSAPAA